MPIKMNRNRIGLIHLLPNQCSAQQFSFTFNINLDLGENMVSIFSFLNLSAVHDNNNKKNPVSLKDLFNEPSWKIRFKWLQLKKII